MGDPVAIAHAETFTRRTFARSFSTPRRLGAKGRPFDDVASQTEGDGSALLLRARLLLGHRARLRMLLEHRARELLELGMDAELRHQKPTEVVDVLVGELLELGARRST